MGPIARGFALLLLPVAPLVASSACLGQGADRALHRSVRVVAFDAGAPPFVSLSLPRNTAGLIEAVRLEFSRPMARGSVETSFAIKPDPGGTFAWADDSTVEFRPNWFSQGVTYDVRVDGLALDRTPLVGEREWTFTAPLFSPFGSPFTLTFDDCGTADRIQAIFDALALKHLRAIFFPTGWCRDQFPWLLPAITAAGHVACNHTYSHPVLTRLPDDAVADQISRGVRTGCPLLRPPYGAWDGPGGRIATIAARLGFQVLLWDVDTRDWTGTSAAAIVAAIHARGGVVLMHMFGAHTVEAILAL